jgi:hypothetical protein
MKRYDDIVGDGGWPRALASSALFAANHIETGGATSVAASARTGVCNWTIAPTANMPVDKYKGMLEELGLRARRVLKKQGKVAL